MLCFIIFHLIFGPQIHLVTPRLGTTGLKSCVAPFTHTTKVVPQTK